jgi:hypothetical protein
VPASIGVFSDAVNRVMSFGSEGRFKSQEAQPQRKRVGRSAAHEW